MRITGVITQGARRLGRSEFVKTYRVAYGDDGKTWKMIKAKGSKEDMVNPFIYIYYMELFDPSKDLSLFLKLSSVLTAFPWQHRQQVVHGERLLSTNRGRVCPHLPTALLGTLHPAHGAAGL